MIIFRQILLNTLADILEGAARFEQHHRVPNLAPASQAAAPAAATPREVVKIKLGDINARIAPLSISADGLALLGFKPINATGAAKLYDQAQFPAMCRAMIDGLQDAANSYPLAA
ncbi:hypothetical protein G6F24_017739 [Rhizopus arrhizus]|nr:hypothetical protein G6F24_017739 [Rhizopus arrhizus]